jgi:hypothetical protein
MNKPAFSTIAGAGLKAILVAVLVNLALFFLFSALGVLDPSVLLPQTNQPLTALPVALASFGPLVLGTLFFWLLTRFTRNAVLIFTGVAVVLGLLSLGGPLTMTTLPTSFRLALCVMHLVPVVSLIWFLRKAASAPTAEASLR